LQEAGLRIEAVAGCGVLGGRIMALIPFERLARWEHALAGSSWSRLGVCQMYVCAKAEPR
jgi:hypothetical protein